jgi:hypothetical protein
VCPNTGRNPLEREGGYFPSTAKPCQAGDLPQADASPAGVCPDSHSHATMLLTAKVITNPSKFFASKFNHQ